MRKVKQILGLYQITVSDFILTCPYEDGSDIEALGYASSKKDAVKMAKGLSKQEGIPWKWAKGICPVTLEQAIYSHSEIGGQFIGDEIKWLVEWKNIRGVDDILEDSDYEYEGA